MNALLLYPRLPKSFWSLDYALKFVHKKSVMPPLGLVTVAALLPTHWTLRLIDNNIAEVPELDLQWADLALISAMGVQRSSVHQLVARCKAAGVPVVAGGPLFTAAPDSFPEIDHLILNEAELTLPSFLKDLECGKAQHLYATAEFAEIRQTPVPRWDLLDMRAYHSMGIQYSRGCPFNCDFCNVTTLFGRLPRTKTAEQTLRELDTLHGAGWSGAVFFVDDNLIGNKKATFAELLPALIGWHQRHRHSGITFNTQVSINLADDPGLLQQFSNAGFDTVFVGIETPDSASLTDCGKQQNRHRNLLQDVKTIQQAGIQVQGGFIVGFDHESPSIFQRQIDFIQKSGIATAMVGLLNALPGTALFERLRIEGRLVGNSSGDNVDGSTNFHPTMDIASLYAGYHRILKTIYAPRNYYRRVRTFLAEYCPPPIHGRMEFSKLRAFVRSLFTIGVLGRERGHYWLLLGWTLLHKPRLLSQAVTLAITGNHFRRFCDHLLPAIPEK